VSDPADNGRRRIGLVSGFTLTGSARGATAHVSHNRQHSAAWMETPGRNVQLIDSKVEDMLVDALVWAAASCVLRWSPLSTIVSVAVNTCGLVAGRVSIQILQQSHPLSAVIIGFCNL